MVRGNVDFVLRGFKLVNLCGTPSRTFFIYIYLHSVPAKSRGRDIIFILDAKLNFITLWWYPRCMYSVITRIYSSKVLYFVYDLRFYQTWLNTRAVCRGALINCTCRIIYYYIIILYTNVIIWFFNHPTSLLWGLQWFLPIIVFT